MGIDKQSDAFQLRRIQFVPARRPDVTPVPTGVDIIVLNGVLPVRCIVSLHMQYFLLLTPDNTGPAGRARRYEAKAKRCTCEYKRVVQGAGREPALEDCAENGVLTTIYFKAGSQAKCRRDVLETMHIATSNKYLGPVITWLV